MSREGATITSNAEVEKLTKGLATKLKEKE
jgi:hypothetical protein